MTPTDPQTGEARQIVYAVVLLGLVLLALSRSTGTLSLRDPLLLIVAAVGTFALVPAGLELAGRPAQQMGLITAVLGLFTGIWNTITSPQPDPGPVVVWLPVLVLWAVLATTRGSPAPSGPKATAP